MKKIFREINTMASTALKCKAVSNDSKEIKRPAVYTDIINIKESVISSYIKHRLVSLAIIYFPPERDTSESELLDAIDKLSSELDKSLYIDETTSLNFIDREFEITTDKVIICALTMEFDVETSQEKEDSTKEEMKQLYYEMEENE